MTAARWSVLKQRAALAPRGEKLRRQRQLRNYVTAMLRREVKRQGGRK